MAETKGFGGVDVTEQVVRKEKLTFEQQLIRELYGIKNALTWLIAVLIFYGTWFFLSR